MGTKDYLTGPQNSNPVPLLKLVQVRAVVLVDASAVFEYRVAGHNPGALSQLRGAEEILMKTVSLPNSLSPAREGAVQGVGIALCHSHLY